jgi:hypothetical protein
MFGKFTWGSVLEVYVLSWFVVYGYYPVRVILASCSERVWKEVV